MLESSREGCERSAMAFYMLIRDPGRGDAGRTDRQRQSGRETAIETVTQSRETSTEGDEREGRRGRRQADGDRGKDTEKEIATQRDTEAGTQKRRDKHIEG